MLPADVEELEITNKKIFNDTRTHDCPTLKCGPSSLRHRGAGNPGADLEEQSGEWRLGFNTVWTPD
jgi:hypothetical protein